MVGFANRTLFPDKSPPLIAGRATLRFFPGDRKLIEPCSRATTTGEQHTKLRDDGVKFLQFLSRQIVLHAFLLSRQSIGEQKENRKSGLDTRAFHYLC